MRLAFATCDPLSVFLTALSAWLITQAAYRYRRGELVAAAAVALALANVTAYSGVFIDPVVITFAFLTWRTRMSLHQSLSCTGWLAGAWALSIGLLMTASHSLSGFYSTVFEPNIAHYQSISSILNEVWKYSALIVSLGLIGILISLKSERKEQTVLLGLLCSATFVVLVAQLNVQTPWSIDRHLGYGIWFAAIAPVMHSASSSNGFPAPECKLQSCAVQWPSLTPLPLTGSQPGSVTMLGLMPNHSSAHLNLS